MRLPWRRKALSATPSVLEALRDRRLNPYPPLGGTNVNITNAYQRGIDGAYGWMYATQPAVRSVVDFIARNASQLSPPKLYKRKGDTERERQSDHAAQKLLAYPDGRTPGDSFFYRVFTDYLIWDNAFIVKFRPTGGDLLLLRLPPNGVTVAGGRFTPETYYVWNEYGEALRVAPENMIHWFGYHPDDPLRGLSKLETLRQELATDRAVQETMVELAKNGLKSGYIERPLDAPMASQEDLLRIAELWKAGKLKGDPILDEGMKYVQSGVTPKDADVIAARRFTKEEVAAQYGVPPAAMGVGDADPSEQRKLVYADVLPPYCNPLACMLNIGLLKQEFNATDLYFEFDLNEKLRGDISERFSQYTAAAGAPWLLRNEIRAKENLPPIEGGDELILPLNVAKEGEDSPALPAPNVMPIQDPNKPPQDGSYREEPKGLKRWNPSQPRDELGRWDDGGGVGGSGGEPFGDSPKPQMSASWMRANMTREAMEARVTSLRGSIALTEQAGGDAAQLRVELNETLRALGRKKALVPGAVDPENRIVHYQPRLRADMARQRRNASHLQTVIFKEYRRQERSTKSRKAKYDVERWTEELIKAIGPLIKGLVRREGDLFVARLGGADFDEREVEHWLEEMVAGTAEGLNKATARDIEALGVEKAFERASEQRAAIAGAQITARATYFGRKEGAKQAPDPERRYQRWIANTDRHAELDGKSVPLGEDWNGITPGSTPNCGCGVDIA